MEAFLFVVIARLRLSGIKTFYLQTPTMKNSRNIIGSTIKHFRLKMEFTMHTLAVKLDIDRQYISKLESGKVNLTMDYLDRIIVQLGCTHEDFFAATRITKL